MNTKNISSIVEYFKALKGRDLVYPSIFVAFSVIIGVVFFFSIQFISKNVNRAFSPEDSIPSQSLDIEKYKLVAKKLGITDTSTSSETNQPSMVATEASTTSPQELNKNNISILIKNATTKKGVAGVLASNLAKDGFTNIKTGNEQKTFLTTTILFKETAQAYEPRVAEVVHKEYPAAVSQVSIETGTADIIVIIGNR